MHDTGIAGGHAGEANVRLAIYVHPLNCDIAIRCYLDPDWLALHQETFDKTRDERYLKACGNASRNGFPVDDRFRVPAEFP